MTKYSFENIIDKNIPTYTPPSRSIHQSLLNAFTTTPTVHVTPRGKHKSYISDDNQIPAHENIIIEENGKCYVISDDKLEEEYVMISRKKCTWSEKIANENKGNFYSLIT